MQQKINKNILFVTTANFTTNPRLLKEVIVAGSKYSVSVIVFDLGNWSQKIDKGIIKDLQIQSLKYLPATKKNIVLWFFSVLVERISRFLYPLLKNNIFISAFASDRRSFILWLYLLSLKNKPNLVVGHNLGTLYPIFFFSKQKKIPFLFDFEDYYPGETIDNDQRNEFKRRISLIKKLVPHAAWYTYASPLIGDQIKKLLNINDNNKCSYIKNSFFSNEFHNDKTLEKSKIKFVWFSQYISLRRGLSYIIPHLIKYRKEIALTLIGQIINPKEEEYLHTLSDFITIVKPLPQKELHQFLCEFDTGLALEISENDFNRDICLTNKIFAYAQAGLYILATDTKSQLKFLEEYPDLGVLVKQKNKDFKSISFIIKNIETIRESKKDRFKTGQKLSFDNEKAVLQSVWLNSLVSKL